MPDLEFDRSYEDSPLLAGTEKPLSHRRKWLIIATLTMNFLALSTCSSIRYGFLVHSFSIRGVPGKVFGLMEGSTFIGCLIAFTSTLAERLMRLVRNSRYLLVGLSGIWFLIALSTGLVYYIPSNTPVVILSGCLRIITGCINFPIAIIAYDFVNANLKQDFDLILGILNMGCYIGHGLSQLIGCYLYDHFGYLTPYLFASSLILASGISMLFVLPNSQPYLLSEKKPADSDSLNMENSKLSWKLAIPLLAIILVKSNYGALQVSITPFLHTQFHKTISYGGMVSTLVSVGMATSSLLCGNLLQREILRPTSIMILGSFSVCMGILICFPQPTMPMYDLAPVLAIPGAFIAGTGDPLLALSGLRTLIQIQEDKTGELSPAITTRVTSIWTITVFTFYYLGSFLAGTISDYFSYPDMGLILACLCFAAVLICTSLRISENFKREEDKTNMFLE